MTWTISEVDVTGHDARAGVARGVIVRFYGTAHHQPHGIIADVHVGWPGTPVMQLKLGQGAVTLSEGRYWMSTQVDGDGADPFWVWHMRSKQHGDGAVWRNPEDGFRTGCAEWSLLDQCATRGVGPDFMFALRGTSTRS